MTASESDPLIGTAPIHRHHHHHSHPSREHTGWIAASWAIILFVAATTAFFAAMDFVQDKGFYDLGLPLRLFHQNHPHKGPRYIGTQFISFTINTLGGLDKRGECEGRDVDPSSGFCYLGNAQNLTEDVEHRLRIVSTVLDRLKDDANATNPVIDHRDDVLKIFMLPEFFIRGPNGAFSTSDLYGEEHVLIDFADGVRDLIYIEEFSNYLFVFGTIIAARSPNDPRKPWESAGDNATTVKYYNFAPVLKGGLDHKHRFFVAKRYVSAVDFLNRASLPNPRNRGIKEYSDESSRLRALLRERETQLIEDNIIEMDGLRIGLEVCLDHRMGALWENLQKDKVPELMDLLLVTSAGMAIERGPNPVVPGGVVYMTDGEASSAACIRTDTNVFDPKKVCREGPAGRKHLPVGQAGYSNFFPLASCIDVEDRELMTGYYSIYQTQGCVNTLKTYGIDVLDEYKEYPPSLEIYPTVALPSNTYD